MALPSRDGSRGLWQLGPKDRCIAAGGKAGSRSTQCAYCPPSVLENLAGAFEKVQTGQVQPKPTGVGKVIYQVGNISFLMRLPADVR
jgi:hypothetical protein